MAHAILFRHRHFRGNHRHFFTAEPYLNKSEDRTLHDSVSSIVVVEGRWEFFRNRNFDGRYAQVLGPGTYSDVEAVDIQNDDMPSLRPV